MNKKIEELNQEFINLSLENRKILDRMNEINKEIKILLEVN